MRCSVAVLGARRATPARSPPQLLHRHPHFELRARDRARGGGRAARRRHPRTACRWCSRSSTPTATPRSTPRSSPTRTARRRRWWPSCASAACGWSTSPPTSGCATAAIYEDWYGEHGAPELFGEAVYGLPELYRERDRAAPTSSPTPAATRPPRCSALAPLARAGLIDDVVIDAKSGVSGAGRAATATTHFISADENVTPYKVERPPPHAGDRAGAGGARRRRARSRSRRTCVPLDQGELVSCYVDADARGGRRRAGALYDDAYARRAVRRGRRRPARRARRARDQLLPHLGPRRPAHRPGDRVRARSTTCGRAPRRRRCRTST